MKRPASRTSRRGFSLLEILVATSMLAIAMATLSQLAAVGRSHLSAATEKLLAARLASNQLERLAAGIDPLVETTAGPLTEDPRWDVRVSILPIASAPGLIEVEVSVRRAQQPAAGSDASEPWYSAARWMALNSWAPTPI